jgi:iron complex transport system substrate-binding protein
VFISPCSGWSRATDSPFTAMTFLLALLFFAAAPQRIVSTTPSITEILFALGLGNRVVGVTTYCAYPPQVKSLPKIGTYIQPDLERITSLKPDLVVIQKNPVQLKARLERLGLTVLELQYDSIPETLQAIRQLASATGVSPAGEKLSSQISKDLDAIRVKTKPLHHPTMAFFVGRSPGVIEGLIAVGRASFLSDLVDIAGGRNAFADTPVAYPKVSLEELLARNPEVIIDMGEMGQGDLTDTRRKAILGLWSSHQSLMAARNSRVFVVADSTFTVPGPRMAQAAKAFAQMLHPEAFR